MMSDLGRTRVLGLAVIAVIVVIDQATKLWFYEFLVVSGRRYVELLPFFNLVTVWNYGVSFGMFNSSSSAGSWIFVILALAIVAVLAYWLWHTPRRLPVVALSLVIGGALGNVVDRLRYGAVFDFLDFHAFGWHWPAFNAADAAITLGVVALFVDSLFGGAQESKKET